MPKKPYSILIVILTILLGMGLYLGSAPPSPLYYLKLTRETIQTFFIFGDEDQANWYLTRAGKRLAEAEKLRQKRLGYFADMQIAKAKEYQWKAEQILIALKDKADINYLNDKYSQNKDRLNELD